MSSSSSSSSVDKSTTAKSVVSTQDDPTAPTTADGVQKADWNGSFFIIPIITGFQVQPQSEQYIVANSSGTGTADLGFKASFVAGALEKVGLSQTVWSWSGTAWTSKTTTSSKPGTGWLDGYILNGNPTVDNTVTFPLGTYYVQYVGSFHGWLDLPTFHSDKKISKLVKVVVVDEPVDATAIKPDVPNVIFENATYEGNAVTTPVNATGSIKWTNDLSGLTFNEDAGRNSSFSFDSQSTTVNTSTTNSGIPTTFTSTITNKDSSGNSTGSTSGDDTSYTGGLVAKVMASDEGGSWSLDSDGLTDLEASVNPASGDNVTWDYQWQYSTDGTGDDISFRNITSNDDGVSNYKGTVSSASELASASNALTFSKTSGFVTQAEAATAGGKDYVVREVLTANVPDQSSDGSGKNQTIEIDSNAASLTVSGAIGKLSLDEVPSFDFGDVSTSDIYNGTIGADQTKPEAKSTLTVSDTRADSNDWSLTAKMTKFESTTSLDNNTMVQMNNLMDNVSAVLTDNNSSTEVLSSKQGDAGSWETTGQLLLNANPDAKLSDGLNFSSTITWNLTAGTPSATAAK